RSRRDRAPAPRRSLFPKEGGGLGRRGRDPLPAAIPRRQGTDLPQQRSRPRGVAGLAPQGKTQDPPRYLEGGGGVGLALRFRCVRENFERRRNPNVIARLHPAICPSL